MTFDEFHNALRILLNLDMWDLEKKGVIDFGDTAEWEKFTTNPYRWFIRADDNTAHKLWALMETRMPKS